MSKQFYKGIDKSRECDFTVVFSGIDVGIGEAESCS